MNKNEPAIADSGTTNTFVTTNNPAMKVNHQVPTITVKVANGQCEFSSGTTNVMLKDTPKETTLGHMMKGLPD